MTPCTLSLAPNSKQTTQSTFTTTIPTHIETLSKPARNWKLFWRPTPANVPETLCGNTQFAHPRTGLQDVLGNGGFIRSPSAEYNVCISQRGSAGGAGKLWFQKESLNRIHSLYIPERVCRRCWKLLVSWEGPQQNTHFVHPREGLQGVLENYGFPRSPSAEYTVCTSQRGSADGAGKFWFHREPLGRIQSL